MATEVLPNAPPRLEHNDVLGPDSSDDEPLVPVHKKAKLAKPVKRERSAAATVKPDTKKAMHVKRERSASAPAEPEPPTIVINDDVPKEASRAPPNSQDRQTDRQTDRLVISRCWVCFGPRLSESCTLPLACSSISTPPTRE